MLQKVYERQKNDVITKEFFLKCAKEKIDVSDRERSSMIKKNK